MSDSILLSRELFLECNWSYDSSSEKHYGYASLMDCLERSAREMMASGKEEHAKVLSLLAKAASMLLQPDSQNEPFKPLYQDFQAGKRSTIPEDFSIEELTFFEDILNDINEPYLRARLADLLWLTKEKRNPEHARIAIDSYTANIIEDITWHRDVNQGWERAILLCKQMRDNERLKTISDKLLSAFHSSDSKKDFMWFQIAKILDKTKLDKNHERDIALLLYNEANSLKQNNDFHTAPLYFNLASKKYKQCSNKKGMVESLIAIAECFELEADLRITNSALVSSSLYEKALQAYRDIPNKYRADYDIDNKITEIRGKITISGVASLDEMHLHKTKGTDISEIKTASIQHVTGKNSVDEAIAFFTGFSVPEYNKIALNAEKNMQTSLASLLFGSTHMSTDGRIVAKVPAMNLTADGNHNTNKATLDFHIQQQFLIQIQLIVEGHIIPALHQLLMEHRVTKELMISACYQAPIVPKGRENLLGYALWLGFEYEFGAAIHLLCPQVEHIVRSKLKEVNVNTSNIDPDGIENENGLSTLMELPEALTIFGENLTFELKSIFTESLGSNLRNEVAHGLLDDNSSFSAASIYAWWMILRLVVRSAMIGNTKSK